MILIQSRRHEDGQHFAIRSPWNPRLVEIAHSVPGLKFRRKTLEWVGYGDAISIFIDKLLKEKIGVARGELPSLVQSIAYDYILDDTLREYQKQAVAFLVERAHEGALLADDTGLGKTRSTLRAIEQLGYPAVVVCPAIVKSTWRREAEKLGLEALILSGTRPPENTRLNESDGIVVINYDILYAWLPVLYGARTVVFDECHALINGAKNSLTGEHKSRRSGKAKELAHSAENRIALSATPFTSRPKELWNVVDTISPKRFGYFLEYAKRYCEAFQEEREVRGGEKKKIWNFDGKSHADELNRRMKGFMLRRTKADVALELPPKQRQIIELDVPMQAAMVDIPQDADREWMRWALSISARGKIKQAVELAANHIREGNNVVVASYRREIAHELVRAFAQVGIDAGIATGNESVKQREKAVAKAIEEGPSVLVVTTHAMGEGIDLSYANIGIVVELDYLPSVLIQFEGRFHRFGQKKNVLIQYLIGLGTLDEIIRDRVVSKLETFEEIIGSTGDAFRQELSNSVSEEDLLAELRDSLREMSASVS